jgi:carbamoyl-phosphate synthase large subunit
MIKNILITSAGRRVSLVNFFKNELKKIFPDSLVLTTDLNPEFAAACRVSDKFFKVPKVSDPNYINVLLDIALENNVKLIIPTIDTELLVLSKNIELFKNQSIDVVISDYEVVKIFRDKRQTHLFFEQYKINIAKEFTKDNYSFPLYIKPIDGSRSVDNYIVTNKEGLTDYHFENDKLMFLEYLDHKKHIEYTIDLYYDKKSELKCLIPRKRIEVRDGEVNKAITIEAKFIPEIWQKLYKIDGFRGCITLQIFENTENNSIYGIEINPRFGGGYPLSYLAGGNFIKWIIDEYLLEIDEISVFESWEKNLMMLRYDSEILVHNFQ